MPSALSRWEAHQSKCLQGSRITDYTEAMSSQRLPAPVEMVRALVAEPSVSSPDPRHDQSNRRVIDLLAGWAEDLGFEIEILPLPEDEAKVNLVATLNPERRSGSAPGLTAETGGLVLSGHSDTVPFEESRWQGHPLELREDDQGRLFGIGSADMKGFFAAALHAASKVDRSQLQQPIVLMATADEESTMNGVRALLSTGRRFGRHAVIGEPTSLTPVRMHKGILMQRLALLGRSGHSSDPSLGNSALEGMHRAIGALLAWREAAQGQFQNPAFAVPAPTLNLGRIEGGDSPNRICPSCSLTFDVRMLPGMALDGTVLELREAVEQALAESGLGIELRELAVGVPPFEVPEDAAIVEAIETLTGKAAEAVMFCTEAPFLKQLGLETVVCGPGSIDVAHQPNEYTTRQDLDAAERLYGQLIHRFCVEGEA